MKHTLLIGLLLTLLCSGAYAQRQFCKPLKSTSQSMLGFSNYNVGLKLGCPWSFMTKSDLHETVYDGNFGYLIGITGERNLGKLSIGLESTLAQKGTKMHNERKYQHSLSEPLYTLKTQYEVAYNVLTVRIPVTYYFKGMVREDKIVPYVFAGPEADIPLGFNFDLFNFKFNDKVEAVIQQFEGPTGENQILPHKTEAFEPGVNISIVAGLGLMTKIRFENSAIIFKFDAAYNQGLMNLAVPTKEGFNWPFNNQEERIFANDVEVNFSIVYPIKKILHDACYNFRK